MRERLSLGGVPRPTFLRAGEAQQPRGSAKSVILLNLFGGGTKRGIVLGKTDKQAGYPTDRPVSAGDMIATIYQLLGVDPTMTVDDLSGRPVGIAHGGEPVWEVIA